MDDAQQVTATDRASALVPLLAENAAKTDATASFPEANLRALRESGLLGLLVPAGYGGLDGDLSDLVSVAEILAAGCLSTAMIWAMHAQQVDVLARHAGPALRADLLPRIARGEVYLASVTTEPGKGGHLLSAVSPIRATDAVLTVERDAPIVTGGEHADGFLVTMRAAEDASGNRVSLVYLDRTQATVTPRAGWDALGMRGTCSVGMRISAMVPEHQVVGEPGGFRAVATDSMIPAGHLAWAGCWLGAAKAAMADLIGLARSAARPRGLNLESDLTRERLARIRIDLELAGAYLHRVLDEVRAERSAGHLLDGPVLQIHLNTLKIAMSELTFSAVDRMIQLAGLTEGYLRGSAIPLERHFRDLRSASLNNSNDRLLIATGALTLMDKALRLA